MGGGTCRLAINAYYNASGYAWLTRHPIFKIAIKGSLLLYFTCLWVHSLGLDRWAYFSHTHNFHRISSKCQLPQAHGCVLSHASILTALLLGAFKICCATPMDPSSLASGHVGTSLSPIPVVGHDGELWTRLAQWTADPQALHLPASGCGWKAGLCQPWKTSSHLRNAVITT
jgi:hypothetical protein